MQQDNGLKHVNMQFQASKRFENETIHVLEATFKLHWNTVANLKRAIKAQKPTRHWVGVSHDRVNRINTYRKCLFAVIAANYVITSFWAT